MDGSLFSARRGYIEVRKYTDVAVKKVRKQPLYCRSKAGTLYRLQQPGICPSARSLSRTSSIVTAYSARSGAVSARRGVGDQGAEQGTAGAFRSLGKRGRSTGYEEQGKRRTVETQGTRRQFVKGAAQAAAVAGFPTIVPVSVFGQMAPSKQISVGAIGMGRISRGHDLPANPKGRGRSSDRSMRSVSGAAGSRQEVRQRLLFDQKWQPVRWRNYLRGLSRTACE